MLGKFKPIAKEFYGRAKKPTTKNARRRLPMSADRTLSKPIQLTTPASIELPITETNVLYVCLIVNAYKIGIP